MATLGVAVQGVIFVLCLVSDMAVVTCTGNSAGKAAHAPTTSQPTDTTTAVKAANILFIAPFGSKSHKNFYDGVIEAIADGGHKVTILTPFHPSRKHKNVKSIVFENNDIAPIMANSFKDGVLSATLNAMEQGPSLCFSALAHENTKKVLVKAYDLVFVSVFFNECFLGAVHSMEVPIVFVNPAEMFGPFTARRMGNPSFPSFSYNPMLSFESPLSFTERLVSVLSDVVMDWMIYTSFNRIDVTGQSLKLFPPSTPSTADISANASLYIVNSIRLAEHPRPYMPNILLAGGIHCRPAQPVAEALNTWLEASGEAGFIYFSLGSAVGASHLSDENVELLMKVFASLPQRVLWKHENAESLASQVTNVRLIEWAPQQDLLGHPKIRLFITHGGLLSTQEATYHGVPVLGLPVFGDQEGNMASAEAQGWGRKLPWASLTEETFSETIRDLVINTKYADNVRMRRDLQKDAPVSPAAAVLWWTEYLIRTGGATHLRSGAATLPWYQLYNLDVWLSLVSIVIAVLWLQVFLIKKVYGRCFGAKNKPKKLKKN